MLTPDQDHRHKGFPGDGSRIMGTDIQGNGNPATFLNGNSAYSIPPVTTLVPGWVDEGSLVWSAETTDKTLTFANAAKDLYLVLINLDHPSNGNSFNMRLNGITTADYDYVTFNTATLVSATAQTSIALSGSIGRLTGQLILSGKYSRTPSTWIKNVCASLGPGTINSVLINAELNNDKNDLSSLTIMVNGGTVTGTVHVYSLNL